MESCLVLKSSEISSYVLEEKTLKLGKMLFNAHGYLKIESLFASEWIDRLLSHLDLKFQEGKIVNGTPLHGGRYIVSIPLKGPFLEPHLYGNPILLALMRAILGPDCILSSLGAVVSLPGSGEQHIHNDYEPLFTEEPALRGALPTYAITVAIPLVDIDVINGPTKIWSGSHRSQAIEKERIDDCFSRHLLCGPKGSCYFWDYRTLHAGGSNHSDEIRPLLYMAFTRRWFKDTKNPDQLLLSEEDRKQIPEELRHLFPFQKYWNVESENEFKSKVNSLFLVNQ